MPLGPWELVIILIIVVVIFGAGRLSQIGGAVGKSVREFRTAVHDDQPETAAPLAASVAPVAVVAAPDIVCSSCETPNPAGRKFCGTCGTALPTATTTTTTTAVTTTAVENTCPSCATVNPTGQVFCGQCGTRLTRAA